MAEPEDQHGECDCVTPEIEREMRARLQTPLNQWQRTTVEEMRRDLDRAPDDQDDVATDGG